MTNESALRIAIYIGVISVIAAIGLFYWAFIAISNGEIKVEHGYRKGGAGYQTSETFTRLANPLGFWYAVAGRIFAGLLCILFGIGILFIQIHSK